MKPGNLVDTHSKKVFVCYSRSDMEAVNAVLAPLSQRGHHFWIDRAGIVGSETWRAKIVEALRNCNAVLFFGSCSSYASRHVATELTLAEECRKPIVPVLLDSSPLDGDIPYFLARLHRVRWHGNSPDVALDEIHRALTTLSSVPDPPQAPLVLRPPQKRPSPWGTAVGVIVLASALAWQVVKWQKHAPNHDKASVEVSPPGDSALEAPIPFPDHRDPEKPISETSIPEESPTPQPVADKPPATSNDTVKPSESSVPLSETKPLVANNTLPKPAPQATPSPTEPASRQIPLWIQVGQEVEVIEPIKAGLLTKREGTALVLDTYFNRGAKLRILDISHDRIMLFSGGSEDAWLKKSQAVKYLKPLP